jgi:hypothetical protein
MEVDADAVAVCREDQCGEIRNGESGERKWEGFIESRGYLDDVAHALPSHSRFKGKPSGSIAARAERLGYPVTECSG